MDHLGYNPEPVAMWWGPVENSSQARCPLPEQVQHDPDPSKAPTNCCGSRKARRLLQTLGRKCSATFLSQAVWIHGVHVWPLCEKPDLGLRSASIAADSSRPSTLSLSGTMDASWRLRQTHASWAPLPGVDEEDTRQTKSRLTLFQCVFAVKHL